jgi:hypothetical protein
MKVGFIGAGTVTGTFARHLLTAGHTIVVSNSRGPETLADFVADLGPGVIAGTNNRPMFQVDGSVEDACNLLGTHHGRQPQPCFGSSNLLVKPRLLEDPRIEEPE